MNHNKSNQNRRTITSEENGDLSGYPVYPANEDIYLNYQEEEEIDPEDVLHNKRPNEKYSKDAYDDNNFDDGVLGSELDIPGSELDDDQEDIGSEDEENNYYSLGDDDNDNQDD